jgi:hypothetical protein
MRRVTTKLAALTTVFSLAVAAPVYAEDSSVEGYGGPGGKIEDTIGPRGGEGESGAGDTLGGQPGAGREAVPIAEVSSPGDEGGALPFTGLDIGLLAAAGALLLALGIGMRRLTRATSA